MVCMHLKLLNVPQYVECGTNLDGMKLIFDQAPSDGQQLHIVVSFGVGLGVSEPTFHTYQLMANYEEASLIS
jgi:hypothetical protein